jgi:hypothetical protein
MRSTVIPCLLHSLAYLHSLDDSALLRGADPQQASLTLFTLRLYQQMSPVAQKG